jgi:hypothetical protein
VSILSLIYTSLAWLVNSDKISARAGLISGNVGVEYLKRPFSIGGRLDRLSSSLLCSTWYRTVYALRNSGFARGLILVFRRSSNEIFRRLRVVSSLSDTVY